MPESNLRFLSARDVKAALPMAEAVEAMKDAFRMLSAGQTVVPPRTHIEAEEPTKGDALFMPSYIPGQKRMGLKIVTLFDENHRYDLPFIQAIVVLLDGETGRPMAVMDGASLTAIRTGAASGAATDLLARPDATTVAVFGAGPQARTQLAAVCEVRSINKATVFDLDNERARSFAREVSKEFSLIVEAAVSPAAALATADVVCTATTSSTPVFADRDLAPGTHINAIGSYKPKVREIPGETVKRARVVVDHVPSAMIEAGDLIMPLKHGLIGKEHFDTELGEVLAGQKKGRESPEQITFFKSVGIAVQDLAAAERALANAERLDLGTELEL